MRTDNTGSVVPLTDALGSTLGLVNASGQIATTYWYDPYGGMSTADAGTNNSTTFTGRESDGSSLLFYRARYFNLALGRFTSEDPVVYSGGPNFHAYAGDDPVNKIDALGYAPKDKWYGYNNRDFQD